MRDVEEFGGDLRIFAGGKTYVDVRKELFANENIHVGPAVIVKSRGVIGFEYYRGLFTHKSELWSYIVDEEILDCKFLYFYLLTQVNDLQKLAEATSVKMPQLSVSDTDSLLIPVPPLEEQRRIVEILDRFDALVNDITVGIPAEIEARRQQYEYYRDLLLTFPRADA